jgi:hypothetical protein
MSLVIGNKGGLLREVVQLLIVGAIVGAVLNSKDIQRYLKIRAM